MGESVGSQEYSIVDTRLSGKIPDLISFDVSCIEYQRKIC